MVLTQWVWFTPCWHSGRGSPIAEAVGVVLAHWAWFTHCWRCGRGSPIAGAVGVVMAQWAWFTHCWRCGIWFSGPASLELPGWERPPLLPAPVTAARLLGAVLSHRSVEPPALCGAAV